MRIGLLTIRLLALAAIGLAAHDVGAQMSGAPAGPIQAMYVRPIAGLGAGPYVDAYGNPVVVPAGYCGQCCDDGCYGGQCDSSQCYGPCDGGCYDGGGSCPPNCGYSDGYGECDGACGPRWRDGFPHSGVGCGYGGYGYGGTWQDPRSGTNPPFPDDVENYSMLPPGRTEQCGPHYFDVRMEAVTMTRDEAFRTPVNFTSLNVFNPSMPDPSQFVLRSDELNFDYSTGFRILGRYDCGPLSVIEFGYWGVNFDTSASFTDPNPVDSDTGNLYSLYSYYGNTPNNVTMPDGPLPWTERSITQRISLESELHNAEFNYRRYWVGFNPTVSGTLLAGFRFVRLREDFQFMATGEAEGQYDEGIKNDMAGFQTGGDIWIHVRQGIRIGAEGKVGLLNNHYTLDNTFSTNPVAGTPPDFTEHFEKDQPALTVDASADVVWDICPSWSVRAGYEIFFVNSVLLAGENFNTGTVYNGIMGVDLPEREPFVNNQGNALYHGAHLGAEFTW
jgi:hypothetical protein